MSKRQPNLILLGIDSLRRDHMSLYGYPRLTTPHITEFAQRRHRVLRTDQPEHPNHPGLQFDVYRDGLLQHRCGGVAPSGWAGCA